MSPVAVLRIRLGVVAGAVTLLCAGTAVGSATAEPVGTGQAPIVRTDNGFVRGAVTGATEAFRGIPYAAPPVGGLRWQPPQPAPRWSGVRDASAFGPHCAQPEGPFGDASTSEDCLYLNVFAPSGQASSRHRNPVLFWIHGGAFVSGASNTYDPAELTRLGVVVVTINYRLGALGFLAHAALAGAPGGPSGDYGLMDQQAALRWVQRNISRFGGDPREVAIFGESAGGLSVLSQLVSPAARGMFARAVAQSGAYSLTLPSLSDAQAAGAGFATAAGCADQTAACLRGLPVETVLAHQSGDYVPNVDGRTLPQSLGPAFAAGQFARVPVINGSTHDEWRLFVGLGELVGLPVTPDNYLPLISETLGVPAEVAARIAAVYPLSAYPSPAVALAAVGTDAIFACPGLGLTETLARFVPTYAYEFNDQNAPPILPPVSFPYGAYHAAELQYLFQFPTTLAPDQQRLADTMRRYWAGFADHGNPNAAGTPNWPRYRLTTQPTQSLISPRPQTATGFAADHQCGFWSALP